VEFIQQCRCSVVDAEHPRSVVCSCGGAAGGVTPNYKSANYSVVIHSVFLKHGLEGVRDGGRGLQGIYSPLEKASACWASVFSRGE